MTDAVNGEKNLRRALSRMQDELGEEFKMRVVDDLFFVAANGEERSLDAAETTIRRMTEELYEHYFTRRPTQPIRVYCFRNRSTYEEYVRRAHGRAPTTPYGFYLSSERKTVLNLATGLGTLAHEIVHPLLCEDFPGAYGPHLAIDGQTGAPTEPGEDEGAEPAPAPEPAERSPAATARRQRVPVPEIEVSALVEDRQVHRRPLDRIRRIHVPAEVPRPETAESLLSARRNREPAEHRLEWQLDSLRRRQRILPQQSAS